MVVSMIFSFTNNYLKINNIFLQVLKYSQSDWNKMKQELELSFQAQLLAKEREWSLKLADRDARILTVEEGSKKLKQTNDDMR